MSPDPYARIETLRTMRAGDARRDMVAESSTRDLLAGDATADLEVANLVVQIP